MTAAYLRGMLGLGDSITQRAVVRELPGPVYLETPWPQLYADLTNVHCVPRPTSLRTQARNMARSVYRFRVPDNCGPPRCITYANNTNVSMLQGMFNCVRMNPRRITYDLPTFGAWDWSRPYIVVRPPTIRAEWKAEGRNPLPGYVARATRLLRHQFDIVSVADLAPGLEWLDGEVPYADHYLHKGELSTEHLLDLIAGAAGCVGGVGWLAPACVAYRVPLFLIYGGLGKLNGPRRIFDPRMPTESVRHAIPRNLCQCERLCRCDRTIEDFDSKVERWAVGLLAKQRTAMAS